ncbi:MAG: hypothetical protein WA957_05485 [Alteraurantiacibacter sp.]
MRATSNCTQLPAQPHAAVAMDQMMVPKDISVSRRTRSAMRATTRPATMLSRAKAQAISETCASESPNSAFTGSTSTFTTIRSIKPTVAIDAITTNASVGDDLRVLMSSSPARAYTKKAAPQ